MARMSRKQRSQALREKNGTRRVSLPGGMGRVAIVPPRDIQATTRYTLPTRSEIFAYSQLVDPRERLADTSGRVGATLFHSPGQSRPTLGNNGQRYVNGR